MTEPLYTPNQLITGHGHVAIVTGWTVKDFVVNKLGKHEYAVIGQLYSAVRGIDFVVRNLLHMDYITHLVIINATKEDRNSGSCQCLADFFANGVIASGADLNNHRINSPIEGYIDREIPLEALELLRHSLTVKTVSSVNDAITLVQHFAKESRHSSRQSLTFPKVDHKVKAVCGEIFGHRIEGNSLAETWLKVLQRIRASGIIRKTAYDSQWQEVIDLMAIINPVATVSSTTTIDPINDDTYAIPDYLPVSDEFLGNYISQVIDDAPVREGVKYTYGQRLRSHFGVDQVKQVIHTLTANPDSARAVINLWDSNIDGQGNPPCLNHVWFRVIQGHLTMTATFRSNDMFAAWCANVIGLHALQRHVANAINHPCGRLITISQSAHIYDDCWDNADKVIDEYYYSNKGSNNDSSKGLNNDPNKGSNKGLNKGLNKRQSFTDPVGNFVIDTDNNKVTINHLLPQDGLLLETIEASSVKDAITKLASRFPSILPYHAMYLGAELQKAFTDKVGYKQG
jgi:thymidylate synthase